MSNDLDQTRQLINDRFDGLEQTLAARMETLDQRRVAGDHSLRQSVDHLDGRVADVTKDLGALDGKLQRVEHDTNRALQVHREKMQEAIREELDRFSTQIRGTLREHQKRTGKIEQRVETIESKLDAVKWAAVGVGVGSGITSGSIVALLTGTLGTGLG